MPVKKKKTTAPRKKITKPKVTSSMGPTYDTQMIITILLLIFIYPVGIIFMWSWMRSWPVWLKLIVSLPLIISIITVVLVLSFVGKVVREARYQKLMNNGYYQNLITPTQKQDMMYENPTVSPFKSY